MKTFCEFITENTNSIEPSSFSIEKFIKDTTSDMSWNSTWIEMNIELIEPTTFIHELGKTAKETLPKCNIYFLYTGADGQSVRKDIIKSCIDNGYKTVKVAVISNSTRDQPHEYLVGLSVPPNILLAHKYDI